MDSSQELQQQLASIAPVETFPPGISWRQWFRGLWNELPGWTSSVFIHVGLYSCLAGSGWMLTPNTSDRATPLVLELQTSEEESEQFRSTATADFTLPYHASASGFASPSYAPRDNQRRDHQPIPSPTPLYGPRDRQDVDHFPAGPDLSNPLTSEEPNTVEPPETVSFFELGDLDEGLAQAAREDKPLLLYFRAPWCAPCKRFEKSSLSNPEVRAAMRDYHARQVNMDQNRELARRLDVHGIPTVLVLDDQGRVRQRLAGATSPREFLARLNSPPPTPLSAPDPWARSTPNPVIQLQPSVASLDSGASEDGISGEDAAV
ncbi:MAG: thioredoxin family protein, partial [Planctomycetales bacterium]